MTILRASSSTLCRIFSGIQPTGVPHLGNYFGAIAHWIKISNERKIQIQPQDPPILCDVPIFSIVDVHAYSSTNLKLGEQLYQNILSTTASLVALGLDLNNCILFKQSDVLEHFYLDNVLDNFVTPQRLTHMTQFKEKTKNDQLSKNGLLNYPVLQAADIMLYRANLVPVGEDQVQHIELTRDIVRKFNSYTGSNLFPEPRPLFIGSPKNRRIKSLRAPEKKMSKSDTDKRSFIQPLDEPDVILDKCKKALTDSISDVYYDPEKRPGVSNLMTIYHLLTGQSMEDINVGFKCVETANFKLRLADVIIERFRDARMEYQRLIKDRAHLESLLREGRYRAEPIASETVLKVKQLLGSHHIGD